TGHRVETEVLKSTLSIDVIAARVAQDARRVDAHQLHQLTLPLDRGQLAQPSGQAGRPACNRARCCSPNIAIAQPKSLPVKGIAWQLDPTPTLERRVPIHGDAGDVGLTHGQPKPVQPTVIAA